MKFIKYNINEMKKYILAIITIFLLEESHAQTDNGMSFPSPNNSFLGISSVANSKSGIDVDLYTGTALVNIPITTLTSRSLSIPVSLNYIGGRGIRVQDYASFVGLGWQLTAGGAISRVVRGFPDEQPNGYLGNGSLPSGAIENGGQWGKVVANYTKNGTSPTTNQSKALGIMTSSPPTADGEPDIFYVQTPFFTFQFTFDENGNPVFSNNTGIKIGTTNFYNSSSYASCSFIVTDDKGNQYYFGSSSASVETSTTSLYSSTQVTFPSTWYLDKIISFNSSDTITFTYASFFNADYLTHHRCTYAVYGSSNADSANYVTIINQPKFLTVIHSSLGEIDFNYTTTGRQDDIHSAFLSNITLKALNPASPSSPNTLMSYGFNYSYFGSPSIDTNILRLRLDNINVTGTTGGITSAPLIFEKFVYNTVSLPSRSNLKVIDYFGYNTAPATNAYNIPLPPSLSYATAGILTSITDVSGLTSQLSYELNDYYNQTSNTLVGGLRVNAITESLPTGGTLVTHYYYVDNSGKSTGQVLSNSYAMNSFQPSSCYVTQYFSESPSNFYDLNGNFMGYSSVKVVEPNSGYTVYSFSNFSNPGGLNFNDSLNYLASTATSFPNITSSISRMYKRGILIDKAIYNSSGQIVSEDQVPLSSFKSLTSPITQSSYGLHWIYMAASTSSGSCQLYGYSKYWTYIENFCPTQTIHIDYDANGNAVTTTTNMAYLTVNSVAQNNNRLIQTISIADSKGNTHTQTFNYPGDSNIPLVTTAENTAIAGMISANNISSPLHITDNKNGIVHETHNSYTSVAYGSGTRIYLASISDYASANRTLIKQQNFSYNTATSNIISVNELGGKVTSIAYGYNNCYPVAKIVNSTDYYYENFEATGNVSGTAHTGTRSNSGNFSVPYTPPAGRSFVMDWWSYNSGIWTFNEQNYTGSTTLTGQIDDIKIFPTDAQMSTVSYNPLIGKSGETDAAGHTITYNYDGVGRLINIKDNDGNIIKTYQYHYMGQ